MGEKTFRFASEKRSIKCLLRLKQLNVFYSLWFFAGNVQANTIYSRQQSPGVAAGCSWSSGNLFLLDMLRNDTDYTD